MAFFYVKSINEKLLKIIQFIKKIPYIIIICTFYALKASLLNLCVELLSGKKVKEVINLLLLLSFISESALIMY